MKERKESIEHYNDNMEHSQWLSLINQRLLILRNLLSEDGSIWKSSLEKRYSHIAIKKLPQMLLKKCEFDKDDYSLNIVHPPVYDEELES